MTQRYLDAVDATWPPAHAARQGPWTIRDGAGGGKRVSAATAEAPVATDDIVQAEAAMAALGQARLFMVRDGEHNLDALLASQGYVVVDPVTLYISPVERLTDVPIPRVTAFAIWEPLAIMAEIWAAGGIGPARLDVMHRATCKTGILARLTDKPAGVGFVALHEEVAMVHAVEVLAHQRRNGAARWIMRRAAVWAAEQGAREIAVLCTEANVAANRLYQSLGFSRVCGYHYRIHPEDI